MTPHDDAHLPVGLGGPRATRPRALTRKNLTWAAIIAWATFCGGALTLSVEHFPFAAVFSSSPRVSVSRHHIEGTIFLPVAGDADATPYALPHSSQPTVVYVWLQGCTDCMPAFEAHRALAEQGFSAAALGARVLSVAYGRADNSWAASFKLADHLVFDDGNLLVRPLGIGTFTTFLVDSHGVVRFWGRPTDEGYRYRLEGAIKASQ